jgi:hypothetical protein
MVSVTTPAGALGGESLAFDLVFSSPGMPGLSASARITVVLAQVHASFVGADPVDIELPFRGNATVNVTLRNDGNGPEDFTLLLLSGGAPLEAVAPAYAYSLGPGGSAGVTLDVRDRGLVSTDRPYTLEVVAQSQASGQRASAIVTVRVVAHSDVSVQSIERVVTADPGANTTFHANVTNTGNTYAVVALSAAAEAPSLEAELEASGFLLAPGGTALVNGTVRFQTPPRAGLYNVTLQATDTRGGTGNASNMTVSVEAVHNLTAAAAPTPAGQPSPTRYTRAVNIQNRGNVDEPLLVVLGFVPVGHSVTVVEPEGGWTVPAFGQAEFTLEVERSPTAPSQGQVEVLLASPEGGSMSVTVDYAFPDTTQDATLMWALIMGGAVVGVAAWVFATRPARKP